MKYIKKANTNKKYLFFTKSVLSFQVPFTFVWKNMFKSELKNVVVYTYHWFFQIHHNSPMFCVILYYVVSPTITFVFLRIEDILMNKYND